MSFMSTGRPLGRYIEVGGEKVHAFYLPELDGSETMTIQTDGFKWKYVRVGDEWVHAAALVDSNGDLLEPVDQTQVAREFWETYTSAGAALAVASLTQNAVYLVRLDSIFAPVPTNRLTVVIGTAVGNIDLGLYTYDGTTFTRQVSTGSTAAVGTNALQTLTLTDTDVQPDWYAAIGLDGSGLTTARVAHSAASPNGLTKRAYIKTSAWSSGLPDTITGAAVSGIMPYLLGTHV